MRNTRLRRVPKASITTLLRKLSRGTRLIIVPNGKKIGDVLAKLLTKWVTRRRESKAVMISYDSVSTTDWVLV